MRMQSFESFTPVDLGPIQEKPLNPFEGGFARGVNVLLDPEGRIIDVKNNKGDGFSDSQLELLRAFSVRTRQHMIEVGLVDPDDRTKHGLRIRNGSKNLRRFAHIDNKDLDRDLFAQIEDYGADGQYIFTTGREAPEWYDGSFDALSGLRGPVLPIFLTASLMWQARNRESTPLLQDRVYKLGLSTVHIAARLGRESNGLFIGGYVRKDSN